MNGLAGSVALPGLLLAVVLGAAVFSDLRSRRIPNTLIVAGWAVAFSWQLLAPSGNWVFDFSAPGAVGMAGTVIGATALLAAFLPFYFFGIMGAGDIKLMSVVGAFFGVGPGAWMQLAGVSLCVLAAGGLLAVLRMIVSRSGAAVRSNLRVILAGNSTRASGAPRPAFDPRIDSADRMPYAVAIAAGTSFYLVAKWAGWMKWL